MKNSLESLSKIFVEDGVDHRVEGRIAVPEPKCEREAPALNAARRQRTVLADGADGADAVEKEEGEPARDEAAHDQAQDQRGPTLLLPCNSFLLHHGVLFNRRLRVLVRLEQRQR